MKWLPSRKKHMILYVKLYFLETLFTGILEYHLLLLFKASNQISEYCINEKYAPWWKFFWRMTADLTFPAKCLKFTWNVKSLFLDYANQSSSVDANHTNKDRQWMTDCPISSPRAFQFWWVNIHWFAFLSYKSLRDLNWPCCKKARVNKWSSFQQIM